jgi:hypothetical protein
VVRLRQRTATGSGPVSKNLSLQQNELNDDISSYDMISQAVLMLAWYCCQAVVFASLAFCSWRHLQVMIGFAVAVKQIIQFD